MIMDWKKHFDIHKEASCGLIIGVILLESMTLLLLIQNISGGIL